MHLRSRYRLRALLPAQLALWLSRALRKLRHRAHRVAAEPRLPARRLQFGQAPPAPIRNVAPYGDQNHKYLLGILFRAVLGDIQLRKYRGRRLGYVEILRVAFARNLRHANFVWSGRYLPNPAVLSPLGGCLRLHSKNARGFRGNFRGRIRGRNQFRSGSNSGYARGAPDRRLYLALVY